jgi:hypothetical protein
VDGAPASPQLGARLTRILDLPARLEGLTGQARERANRLLDVRPASVRTDPPASLAPWLAQQFGSAEAVREQTVIKVTNRATLEATLFAPLRGLRPVDGPASGDLAAQIASTEGDPFCSPETGTPAHSFGRVHGARMRTGANAAGADANHAVLVFDRHDPLDFDAELVADLFATGRRWAERARLADPGAANYQLIWNCLWRAGGSIIHGHAQALLGAGPHYARLERFRRDALAYREAHAADLVGDLLGVHRDLGLAADAVDGVTVVAHVTPIKEREVLVVGAAGMDERDPAFTDAVARTLLAYRDRLGVRSFNLALWRGPLDGSWDDFSPIVRLVDRGDPFSRPSDIGAMELYGTPIVGSDPYEVIAELRG